MRGEATSRHTREEVGCFYSRGTGRGGIVIGQ